MIVYVAENRLELIEALVAEGVTYQECKATTEREAGISAVRMVEIQANVPEVIPVPPEYTQGDTELRAWRLPSGKLVITDMDGNLEQIVRPLCRRLFARIKRPPPQEPASGEAAGRRPAFPAGSPETALTRDVYRRAPGPGARGRPPGARRHTDSRRRFLQHFRACQALSVPLPILS